MCEIEIDCVEESARKIGNRFRLIVVWCCAGARKCLLVKGFERNVLQ